MHKIYHYTSVFSQNIKDYIYCKREAGFKYDNPAYWLYRFDQFCNEIDYKESYVNKHLYDKWSHRFSSETKTTQNNRLQALRGFCVYLNTLGIESYIPKNLPRPEKIVPYLMTDKDIVEFFEKVDLYKTTSNIAAFNRMSYEYPLLFRLIYCCGLRNNEACSLKICDMDLDKGIITLYRTKGNKERLVYLADDLCSLCLDYVSWIKRELGNNCEWAFPGKDIEEHIPKTSVDRKFNEFWNKTDAAKVADKKPTVHCLRHAFVIKRINLWMEEGISLNSMMPFLSAYLGHKSPNETFYYYHQVEDVFSTLKLKDNVSMRVIPEVKFYE